MINKEIEERLYKQDPKICAIYATRCVLRTLPYLADNEYNNLFPFWSSKTRSQNLLATFRAIQASLSFCAYSKKFDISIANAVEASSIDINKKYSHAKDIVRSVSFAAYTADFAYQYSISNKPINEITNALEKTISIATKASLNSSNKLIQNEALYDLERIENKESLLCIPLWPNHAPEEWKCMLERFETAIKALDEGFDIWLDWFHNRVVGHPLNKELEEIWFDIPAEIKSQGTKTVNTYISSLRSDLPQKPLNLVRSIFIGNGAAGKTSLIRALHNEPVVVGKEEMTPGIEIRKWDVEGTNIKAHFWDFGGQVMSHSTHQFFLRERCLYVLVLESRSEFNANDQAEYWLEHIKAFSKNAPVMLIGNKADLTSVNLDMHNLKEKYHNIVGFFPISCSKTKITGKYKLYFESFKEAFIEQLQSVGTHQVYFTDEQFAVLEEVRIRSIKNAFLSFSEFDDICKENQIGKIGLNEDDFLQLLDSLGEIIHFPNLSRLDAFVLNPRWLTYGVYTLLYSDHVEKQFGKLSENDVIEILQSKSVKDEYGNTLDYPSDKCGFIIDAMEEFQLCYRLRDRNKSFVIPDKLPSEQPELIHDFDKNKIGTLKFEYQFRSFLPRHIMPNIIVSRHEDIHSNKVGTQLVWQNGVILYNKNLKALSRVQVDYHQRVLKIWVQGNGSKEYIAILNDEIQKILSRMEKLESEEMFVLPENARISDNFYPSKKTNESDKITFKRLVQEAKQGQENFISDSGNSYNVELIVNSLLSKSQQEINNISFITNNFNNDVGMQTIGNNNQIISAISLNQSQKKDIFELQVALTEIMSVIEIYDIDFKVKSRAYNEFSQLDKKLSKLEDSKTPEIKNDIKIMLENIKQGTSEAINLAKKIKDSEKTLSWLMEKTELVSSFLQGL